MSEQTQCEQLTRMSRRPSTPGDLLADLLESNNLTQSEVAARINLSRVTINRIVQGHRPITADIAHRLGRLFGGSPALWLDMQQQVELWDTLHMDTSEFEMVEQLSKAAQPYKQSGGNHELSKRKVLIRVSRCRWQRRKWIMSA